MWDQRAYEGRQGRLYRGQPRPSGEQGCFVRQGIVGDHAGHRAFAVARADEAGRSTRVGRVCRDFVGRGAVDCGKLDGAAAERSAGEAGVLYRAGSVAKLHQLFRAGLRHAELCGAWRVLLGQHGGGGDLYNRRRVLGVRAAGLGLHKAVRAVRRGRGSRQQPDQDGDRQDQDAWGQGGGGEPDPLWL
ncbi:hypothetical protein GALL_450040 [mine drainage metagenome]|uniref:Uncharacterized protein n=1 Tax=mine drainage metagenome TaxID=410659 RepID=A0A1J5PQF0_9ZZZZ